MNRDSPEKRMAGDYEIIHAVQIGDREVVVGEKPGDSDDDRYMCSLCESNGFMVLHSDVYASDHYPEIMEMFGQRISEQAHRVCMELNKPKVQGIPNAALTDRDCTRMADFIVVQRKPYPPDFGVVGEILLQCHREHVALLPDRDAAEGQIVICPPRLSGLLHHRRHGERVYGAFRNNEHVARALQRKRIPLVAAIHLQLQRLLTCGALHGIAGQGLR